MRVRWTALAALVCALALVPVHAATAAKSATAKPAAPAAQAGSVPVAKRLVKRGAAAPVPVPLTAKSAQQDPNGYDLTLVHTGRDGQPNTNHTTTVEQLDSGTEWPVDPTAAVSTLQLPPGNYAVISYIYDTNGDFSLLAQPLIDLTGPQEVDLDARLARPVTVTIPDETATQQIGEVVVWVRFAPDFTEGNLLIGATFDHMYTARIGPETGPGRVSSQVHGEWMKPGGAEEYNLAWIADGQVMTGFDRMVAASQLATVHREYASEADGVTSNAGAAAISPGGLQTSFDYPMQLQAPGELVTHYNTDGGIRWQEDFDEGAGIGRASGPPIAYTAGHVYNETWNRGVFAPSFGAVTRTQNSVNALVGMYGDGDGRFGMSDIATQQMTLTCAGVVKGTDTTPYGSQFGHLPAATSTYQLQIDATRGAPASLATHTRAVWTFKSAATDADTATPLPLWMVRSSPDLDVHNTAPAGRVFPVPVIVTPQAGADVGTLNSLSVDVSYDDGQTWQPSDMLEGIAQVVNPRGSGYVSLRVTAGDSHGNTVTETIIRAYAYAPVA